MNEFGQKHVLLAGAAGRAVLCSQLMEGCVPALLSDDILTNVTERPNSSELETCTEPAWMGDQNSFGLFFTLQMRLLF